MNVMTDEVASDLHTLQVCSGEAIELDTPTLNEPGNKWNNVTVKNPSFRWGKLDIKTLALKCEVCFCCLT